LHPVCSAKDLNSAGQFQPWRVKIGPENFPRLAEQKMDTPWVPRDPRPIAGRPSEILELAA